VSGAPTSGLPVRSLALHARYQCERSGVCCGSGWAVPLENVAYRGLRDALDGGRLRVRGGQTLRELLPASPGLPDAYAAVFGQDEVGRCLFYEEEAGRGRCAVHHQLGPDALPLTCRHFPRLCLVTPHSVDVTLSHYCPTAAGLLFVDAPAEVTEAPPAFPPAPWYEGLDARASPGPLLRPGVFLGWDAHRAFERAALATLMRPDLTVPQALDVLAGAAERARAWRPEDGPLPALIDEAWHNAGPTPPPIPEPELWAELASCVPRGLSLREDARAALASDPGAALPAPELATALPVRRYLAARTFASWLALQGQGLRTAALGPRVAWLALRIQAGRLGGVGSEEDLKEAIRAADLVLVHLAAPELLAARLRRYELA
jgi:hypothetical protein